MDNLVQVERKGNRIEVRFSYDVERVEKIRTIAGKRFSRTPYNHWTVPLDMSVCRQLRKLFGDDLRLGNGLRSWAINQVREEESLGKMAASDSGHLVNLPNKLPTLWRALYFGPMAKHAREQHGITEIQLHQAECLFSFMAGVPPYTNGSYQTADVRFLADAKAPLNANHQGLGKTLEAIAEIFESNREAGWHLIIAPSAAVDGTWEPELEQWLADYSGSWAVFACYGNRRKREAKLHAAIHSQAHVNFVIINPAMVTFKKDPFNRGKMAIRAKDKEYREACHCDRMKSAHWHYEPSYPDLMAIYWDTIINDEVHKGNIRNHRTITGHSMEWLKLNVDGKPVAMSGTPMKKKGADIWGVLHWLRRDVFTSYWNFARMFFDVEEGWMGHPKVGVLREEMEQEFYRFLTPYVVRRTKAEALPWLPAKMHIPVLVTLGEKQRRQYDKMEQEGMAAFDEDDKEIPQTSILAEFTRMQQFANCYHGRDMKPNVNDSAKLDALFEKLDEAGILDGSSNEQTIIFSRFKEILDVVAFRLKKAKVQFGYIHGGIKERRALREKFQAGGLPIMLVVTSAGGVSLTLDAADTAHFIEPSWAPDEAEQAEDRIHRASRIHQVMIYTYIATDTIDEYITETAFEKDEQHVRILDVRRKVLERLSK